MKGFSVALFIVGCLSLSTSAQTGGGGPPTVPQVVVTITVVDPEGSEIPEVPPGMGMPQRIDPAALSVNRTGPTNNPLTVYYRVSGTASNGVDFQRLPGQIDIPAGSSNALIEVLPIDDFLIEGKETVVIDIQPPVCIAIYPPPPECYSVGQPSRGIVTILDNDGPPPTNNYPPNVHITAPANNATFRVDSTVHIEATTVDRDGYAPFVEFFAGTNKIGEQRIDFIQAPPPGTPIDFSFDWNNVPAGRYALTVRAVDDRGAAARSDPVFIAVGDFPPPQTNSPPHVRITSPPDGANFQAPATIQIEAETVDRDGYAAHIEFFANRTKIGEQTIFFFQAPPPGEPIQFTFVWSNVTVGAYTLSARARDDRGAIGVSAPVNIVVRGSNQPPPLPSVTITAPDAFASEGGWRWIRPTSLAATDTNSNGEVWWITEPKTNIAKFVVRRTGDTNTDLRVYYSIGGSASNGVDYEALSGNVLISAGERSAPIIIVPIDDNLSEDTETIILELSYGPIASAPAYIIGRPDRAGAVLADNDSPRPPCIRLGDTFHVCLPGLSGATYTLQGSDDLAAWMDLATFMVVDGAIHYLDVAELNPKMRFYRAMPSAAAE